MSWQDGEINLKLLRGVWLNIQTLIFSCLLKTACLCLLPVPCLSSLPAGHSSGLPCETMETQGRHGYEIQNILPVGAQVSCTAPSNLKVLIKVPFYVMVEQRVFLYPMCLTGLRICGRMRTFIVPNCYSQLSLKPVTSYEESLYGIGVYLLHLLVLLAAPETWSEQCCFPSHFLGDSQVPLQTGQGPAD